MHFPIINNSNVENHSRITNSTHNSKILLSTAQNGDSINYIRSNCIAYARIISQFRQLTISWRLQDTCARILFGSTPSNIHSNTKIIISNKYEWDPISFTIRHNNRELMCFHFLQHDITHYFVIMESIGLSVVSILYVKRLIQQI